MQTTQLTASDLSPLTPAYDSILALAPYQTGKPIEELTREYGVSDVVKLASNENPMGCSPRVTLAVTEQLGQLSRYPDGNGYYLKQALADFNDVNANQITLGNGSDDLLDILARSFVGADDAIVYSQYAFVVYPMLAKMQGATGIEVPAQRFGHNLKAMSQAVQDNPNTKIVFIANPNNPTGTQLEQKELRQFVASVPSSVLVVLDEAYIEYSPESNNRALLNEFDNVIIVRTFSKAYGLAGLRVGYALSSVAVANLLNRIRQPFNVSRVGLAAAAAALADQDFIEKTRLINDEQMRWLEKQFDALGLGFVKSHANFIMVEVQVEMEDITAASIHQALLEQGVIVRPLDAYGLPNWLRITVGVAEDNLRLIDTLRSILTED
ncbi:MULTISPECIES: histidinol-phosphate transaminase [Psychrobacter]|uniref:histidinol-phosphate transaminase n=1 Tax=Psychrobacter TaxID=497 RepID=UPI0008695749|nr:MULTISPECIES: histidinol-phosphate transaminase [Psychrobacter]MBA6245277.1 histidinol-phosphate transaminase [Psychrobacter sp. Urea-trap-18]MBA6285678.1 histidinol-phosphate transaminase [Psychrobacter sp. Urea-trap-16]MBA6318925.1 histidinol-phosphate transaminase [Psychrobacter sp. Urea-trap-20]MBA6333934.1 histidinol-phosphate transaminase [Psychrobacter sp. Urea-trap-19]OEH68893.1 MAG: histidinol-phosphate transaminase [Psychrobacter sp. B29-1]|tara:strand:+ start:5744 stop:6886 length:1143 start_codon:yes stop_codon:yes gene_type:complete